MRASGLTVTGSARTLPHSSAPNHARLARGDAQEREARPLRRGAILLPVLERPHADAERLGKALLREADETPQRRHVAGRDLARDDARTAVLDVRRLGASSRRASTSRGLCLFHR